MKKIKNQKQTNEKGITLVALVVTIIVLMILAGITLSLVLGQNGIIGKAQQAKEASTNADIATAEGINNLADEADDAIEGPVSQLEKYRKTQSVVSSNTAIKDEEGNTVTIPAGFKIASDSAIKQEDGIVIEDKDGNQYVWIPVANISNYVRTDFGKEWTSYTSFSETIPSNEQTSVSTYHGYYIGRYEAGDVTSTASKTLRASGASVTNVVSVKKGQVPYDYVTRDQAITLATGIKAAEGYIATTKLCSSYARDTVINFLQNKVPNYATTSPQGNYLDTTFTYTDITGATQTKASGSGVLIPTGETTPVCNIYDMGGNEWEWTTETCSDSSCCDVLCGGYFGYYSTSNPAGYRNGDPACSEYHIGFRATLYM